MVVTGGAFSMPEMQHDDNAGVFPVRLLLPQERLTLETLTSKAIERAPNAAMFETHEPVFWTVEASNTRLDSYSTHMDVSTLKNYAADAAEGVSFQDGHLTDGLVRTLGSSIVSRYIGPNAAGRDPGVAAVEVDFYTLLGIDPAIDSFVSKAQAGLVRDVSVGFYGGWYHCDLCDRDMQDYSDWSNYCPHIPGMRYPVYDAQGKPTKERVLATAGVMDAHLAEVSGVYSGSTPEASILAIKARQLADAGKIDRDVARYIARRYRIKLAGTDPTFPGATIPKEATPVGEVNDETRTPEQIERRGIEQGAETRARADLLNEWKPLVLDACRAAGITVPEGEDIAPHLRALATVATERAAEIARLTPLADDGKKYRADLIADALAEGQRALGNDFAPETYRTVLDAAPLDTIKRFKADWTKAGDTLLKGGRSTLEEGDTGHTDPPKQEDEARAAGTKREVPVPMSAYRAGRG